MTKLLKLILSFALSSAISTAAFAHGSTEPRHGGVVQMNGETLFELVAETRGVALYVLDDDEPVTASEKTAKLSISVADAKRDIELVPAGGNRFFAEDVTLPAGARIGVMVIDKASLARSGATFIIN